MMKILTMKTAISCLVEEHREAVLLYQLAVSLATVHYPEPLNEGEKSAYKVIPLLIGDCFLKWEAIPEDMRPAHYLLTTVS